MDTKNTWAPERIYLQREAGEGGSHTWCEDSQASTDVIEEAEYVRADVAALTPSDTVGAPIPRVYGVSRMADNPCAVLVMLKAEPSDDALRAIHDRLAAPVAPAAPVVTSWSWLRGVIEDIPVRSEPICGQSVSYVQRSAVLNWLDYGEHQASAEFVAPAAVAPKQVGHNALVLTGAQLLEALDFIAPDRDADQLKSEATIQRGNGHEGNGTYCWCTEYPDEGAILLDGNTLSASDAAAEPLSNLPAKG
jgi:hypothetical protein